MSTPQRRPRGMQPPAHGAESAPPAATYASTRVGSASASATGSSSIAVLQVLQLETMMRNTFCLVAVKSLASCSGQTVAPEASSVILIVVDTLRADHLGLYGYDRPTSPNLDAWAKDGRVFDHAYAPSPWTLPSFASIYTGHWPLIHQGGRTVRLDTGGSRHSRRRLSTCRPSRKSCRRRASRPWRWSTMVPGAVVRHGARVRCIRPRSTKGGA